MALPERVVFTCMNALRGRAPHEKLKRYFPNYKHNEDNTSDVYKNCLTPTAIQLYNCKFTLVFVFLERALYNREFTTIKLDRPPVMPDGTSRHNVRTSVELRRESPKAPKAPGDRQSAFTRANSHSPHSRPARPVQTVDHQTTPKKMARTSPPAVSVDTSSVVDVHASSELGSPHRRRNNSLARSVSYWGSMESLIRLADSIASSKVLRRFRSKPSISGVEQQKKSFFGNVISSLSHWKTQVPPQFRFLFLTLGVFFFYMSAAVAEERLFRFEGFIFGWWLTLVQFLAFAALSYVHLYLPQRHNFHERLNSTGSDEDTFVSLEVNTSTDKKASSLRGKMLRAFRSPLVRQFVLISILQVMAMGLSTSSLAYLNFPTKVIMKSSKLIFMMFFGRIILGKRYTYVDYVAALSLITGMVFFTIADADATLSLTAKWMGYSYIFGSLISEALVGNLQKRCMDTQGVSSSAMILYTYSVGSLFLLLISFLTDELYLGTAYVTENPETWLYIFMFSVFSYYGLYCVLSLVDVFDPVCAVTVTSLRKTSTVILSFVIYPKPWSSKHLIGGIGVFLSIFIHVYSKHPEKAAEYFSKVLSLFQRKSSDKKKEDVTAV